MKIKGLFPLLLASVLGGFIAVFAFARISDNKEHASNDASPSNFHLMSLGSPNILDVSYPDLTFAAEKAVHCVVHVKVKTMEERYGSFLDYFYGRTQQIPREGYGSGVIISSDGYIVTNNHVISGSDEIEVVLNDNRAFPAKVIGKDPSTDLALLKIDEANLPYLTFGDSEATRVGEWVLAVGNPFNLMSTVTAGIVSAKGRRLEDMAQPRQRQRQQQQINIEAFIQTDAAVNVVNSGGALVNIRGELIGINSQIASRTGDFSGNAFAIPATIVQKVVADLKEFGNVQRAILGLNFNYIENAKEELTVVSVTENGGSAAAGVKEGDIVTAINNVPVKTFAELQEQLAKYRPNDQVDVTVNRDQKTQHFKVTLHNIDGNTQILRGDNSNTVFGAIFEEISNRDKQSLRIRSGVKVKDVGEGDFKELGIRNGFIVTAVNDKSVNSAKDIQNIINSVESRGRITINGVYPNGQSLWYGFNKK